MTDWQRLEQVIKWTGLSTNAFALGIGLKRSENLYQIKRGNNGISKELSELIAAKYPAVDRLWLLTGEGTPFEKAGNHGVMCQMTPASSCPGIPYYNADVNRTLTSMSEIKPLYYIHIPSLGACDFAVTVLGEAMAPEIPGGSIVAVRATTIEMLIPGEIYIVQTRDFAIVRRVTYKAESDTLDLRAVNSRLFDEIHIGRHLVESLYLVKGVLINRVP